MGRRFEHFASSLPASAGGDTITQTNIVLWLWAASKLLLRLPVTGHVSSTGLIELQSKLPRWGMPMQIGLQAGYSGWQLLSTTPNMQLIEQWFDYHHDEWGARALRNGRLAITTHWSIYRIKLIIFEGHLIKFYFEIGIVFQYLHKRAASHRQSSPSIQPKGLINRENGLSVVN